MVITGSKINAGEGDKNMADYIKGVDLSAVAEVEELGAKYYDNGVHPCIARQLIRLEAALEFSADNSA